VRGKHDEEIMATTGEPVVCDVRTEWSWVKLGIEEILKENPQLPFRPEDVYTACVTEQATLWCAPEGFVVTTGQTDHFSGERTLLLWLAWAKKRGQNCAIKYYPFFSRVAKEAGFSKIKVKTAVSQMEDYLIGEGWTKDTVVYTRDL